MTDFAIGDRVEWKAKKATRQGVITDIKTQRRRRGPSSQYAEIVEDNKNTGYWQVDLRALTKLGSSTKKQAITALGTVTDVILGVAVSDESAGKKLIRALISGST